MFPRDQLPPDLRLGRTVEVTDVSEEFLSDTDMRNKLAEYVVADLTRKERQLTVNVEGLLYTALRKCRSRARITRMGSCSYPLGIRLSGRR